jgi:hypothetical protein
MSIESRGRRSGVQCLYDWRSVQRESLKGCTDSGTARFRRNASEFHSISGLVTGADMPSCSLFPVQ